jgi:hypothetical protein
MPQFGMCSCLAEYANLCRRLEIPVMPREHVGDKMNVPPTFKGEILRRTLSLCSNVAAGL